MSNVNTNENNLQKVPCGGFQIGDGLSCAGGILSAKSDVMVVKFDTTNLVSQDSNIGSMQELREANNSHKVIIAMSEASKFPPMCIYYNNQIGFVGYFSRAYNFNAGGSEGLMAEWYTLTIEEAPADSIACSLKFFQRFLA